MLTSLSSLIPHAAPAPGNIHEAIPFYWVAIGATTAHRLCLPETAPGLLKGATPENRGALLCSAAGTAGTAPRALRAPATGQRRAPPQLTHSTIANVTESINSSQNIPFFPWMRAFPAPPGGVAAGGRFACEGTGGFVGRGEHKSKGKAVVHLENLTCMQSRGSGVPVFPSRSLPAGNTLPLPPSAASRSFGRTIYPWLSVPLRAWIRRSRSWKSE